MVIYILLFAGALPLLILVIYPVFMTLLKSFYPYEKEIEKKESTDILSKTSKQF